MLLALIVFVGIALRLYNLDHFSFTMDEVVETEYAGATIFNLRTETSAKFDFGEYEPVRPAILYWWLKISDTDYFIRLLSVVFWAMSLVFFYGLANSLFRDATTTLVALALFSLSPLSIFYSRYARLYALLSFVAMFAEPGIKRTGGQHKRPGSYRPLS